MTYDISGEYPDLGLTEQLVVIFVTILIMIRGKR
jgi:hypothetical protein